MTDPTYTESQLHAAVQESCSCGGSSPGEGCGACDVWHFLHGRHWTNLRQPCEACEGRGSEERATAPPPVASPKERDPDSLPPDGYFNYDPPAPAAPLPAPAACEHPQPDATARKPPPTAKEAHACRFWWFRGWLNCFKPKAANDRTGGVLLVLDPDPLGEGIECQEIPEHVGEEGENYTVDNCDGEWVPCPSPWGESMNSDENKDGPAVMWADIERDLESIGEMRSTQPDATGAEVVALVEHAQVFIRSNGVTLAQARKKRHNPNDADLLVLLTAAVSRLQADHARLAAALSRADVQLDDTQRRLQSTEDARQRVCFARDRFAEQLDRICRLSNGYHSGGSDAHTTLTRIADCFADPFVDTLRRCPECGSSSINETETVCMACSNRAWRDR